MNKNERALVGRSGRGTDCSSRTACTDSLQWLRFNGDKEAFINSNFLDFISLLPGNVVWVNKTIMACNGCMIDQIGSIMRNIHQYPPQFKRQISNSIRHGTL
jgi:hypothetical protein